MATCNACHGDRFLIVCIDGIEDRLAIERCDACSQALSDTEVRQWPKAQAALAAAANAPRSIRLVSWSAPNDAKR